MVSKYLIKYYISTSFPKGTAQQAFWQFSISKRLFEIMSPVFVLRCNAHMISQTIFSFAYCQVHFKCVLLTRHVCSHFSQQKILVSVIYVIKMTSCCFYIWCVNIYKKVTAMLLILLTSDFLSIQWRLYMEKVLKRSYFEKIIGSTDSLI